MKRVYSNDNVPMVWHVRNMLEQQGIDVIVRNEKLYSVVGEVPVTECMPEVWVKSPLQHRYAEQLIAEMESGTEEVLKPWYCGCRGEFNEGSFAVCWRCESPVSMDGETS